MLQALTISKAEVGARVASVRSGFVDSCHLVREGTNDAAQEKGRGTESRSGGEANVG